MRLTARRAPSGRVECGQPSCRKPLPGILRMRTLGEPWLFLGLGWTWDEQEVWHPTERAVSNRDFLGGLRDDARRHHADERPSTQERVPVSEGFEGFRPRHLPVEAVCPSCHSIQRLDPEVLGVGRGRTAKTACSFPGCSGFAVRFGLCPEHQDHEPRDEITDHAVRLVAFRRDVDTG